MSVNDDIIRMMDISHATKSNKLSDILKLVVDKCRINQNKYVIIGSYGIRRYREIGDLDVIMERTQWNKLAQLADQGVGRFEDYNGQKRYFLDLTDEYKKTDPTANDFSIEIFSKELNEGYPNNKFSIEYLHDHNGLTRDDNNHPHFTRKTLLKWKNTTKRPKDVPDVKLIEFLIEKYKTHRKRCPRGHRRNHITKKCKKMQKSK
jgi:hypothetical protein